jgi:CubicO group peptidase (beta-lactamase class C family)
MAHEPSSHRRAELERVMQHIPTDHPLQSQPTTASLRERMNYYASPGVSIAVIVDGEIAWTESYGLLEAGRPTPVTPETLFQACSISKQVAMIGALRLVAAGMLDLDRDVNADLVQWKVPANGTWQPHITLRHLLSHTAGLTLNWYRGYRSDGAQPTLQQVLLGTPPSNTPPVQSVLLPGSQFRYSGSHYSVLQQLMMDVTGQAFPALMQELVFGPLGMTRSSYHQTYSETAANTVAVGHHIGSDQIVGKWRVLPEMAAAGLWTTPTDLARVAIMIQQVVQGRSSFLPQALVEQALTSPTGGPYGLGLELDGSETARRFSHSGTNIGYSCLSVAYVEHGLGAVVMTNCDDGHSLIAEIMQALAKAYVWPGYTPHRQVISPAPSAADWVGSYELRPGYSLTITHEAGQLWLAAPGQPPLALYPTSPESYLTHALNSEVRFRRKPDGAISLVLQQEGQEQSAPKAPVAATVA